MAYADPTHLPRRQLGPRSPDSCAGTSQVGCPAHLPGNQLQACPAHLAEHTPLLTQQPACGRGQRAVGGQAEEVGFGKPSLNQSRTKASAGRLPSPGGQRAWREDESPGIVRQLCPGRAAGEGRRAGLNSAALSRSGRAAYYHTAGLVNRARLGARSGGQGCGHSTAVLRAGPSSQGAPRPWLCDPQAGHLL